MFKNSSGWIVWLLLVLALVWLGTVPFPGSSPSSPLAPGSYRARVAEIATDQSTLRVNLTDVPGQPARNFAVPGKTEGDKALRALLKSMAPGDLVNVTALSPKRWPLVLDKLTIRTREVSPWQRWLTFGGAALLLLLFARAALGGPISGLIIGLDGRTSNSKFQLVVWFGVVMVAYLSTVWLRFCYSGNLLVGAVSIPNNLLALSGLSALSFAGAKAITQGKQNALAAAGMGTAMKQSAADPAHPARLADLAHDDAGNPDLGDFQMLLITLIAAITYLVQIFMFLGVFEMRGKITIPDADSTLLAAFGLGQGAYLAKKVASGPKVPNAPPAPGAEAVALPPVPGGGGGAVPLAAAAQSKLGVES
jgi:hypothetical protein